MKSTAQPSPDLPAASTLASEDESRDGRDHSIALTHAHQVRAASARLYNQCYRKWKKDPTAAQARALTSMLALTLRAIETSDLEVRVNNIEARYNAFLESNKGGGNGGGGGPDGGTAGGSHGGGGAAGGGVSGVRANPAASRYGVRAQPEGQPRTHRLDLDQGSLTPLSAAPQEGRRTRPCRLTPGSVGGSALPRDSARRASDGAVAPGSRGTGPVPCGTLRWTAISQNARKNYPIRAISKNVRRKSAGIRACPFVDPTASRTGGLALGI